MLLGTRQRQSRLEFIDIIHKAEFIIYFRKEIKMKWLRWPFSATRTHESSLGIEPVSRSARRLLRYRTLYVLEDNIIM